MKPKEIVFSMIVTVVLSVLLNLIFVHFGSVTGNVVFCFGLPLFGMFGYVFQEFNKKRIIDKIGKALDELEKSKEIEYVDGVVVEETLLLNGGNDETN